MKRVDLALGAMLLGSSTTFSQETNRASVDSAGVQGNAYSDEAAMSADGRFIAFESAASNLVPGDTNGSLDIFVHDGAMGITERVSVDSTGVEGNADSGDNSFETSPSISADGRFVAFHSAASNLVPGDTNGVYDIFVRDRATGTTGRVSVDSLGLEANDGSFQHQPSISSDGRFVAFFSLATNLVPDDTNDHTDVFVHDRATGTTTRISVDSLGRQANDCCGFCSISADGRFVAFYSYASNLAIGDSNHAYDVFVYDRATGTTSRVSVDSAGVQGNSHSFHCWISPNGRAVAFLSLASNLVPGDSNRCVDVFIHDRTRGTTSRVSVDSAGVEGDNYNSDCSTSRNGRFVAFRSLATNLVPGDTNRRADVFVHDRATGSTARVSLDSAGVEGNLESHEPSISADGRVIAFGSSASNLVLADTNGRQGVFVRPVLDPRRCRAGTVTSGLGAATDVLFINGSPGGIHRIVTATRHTPIQVELSAAPTGPGEPGNPVARYVLWVWPRFPSTPFDLATGGSLLGCTVNPTPLRPLASPQPVRCLRGTGTPMRVCQGVLEIAAPARAPWTRTVAGFAAPTTLTWQGVLEDNGAGNGSGYSVTNAVILRVD